MRQIRNKTIWCFWAVAFVAVGLSACQKGQSDVEDLETWIVKNYFLPDDKPQTVKSSFELCEINSKAINNLNFIYGSEKKDLGAVVDDLNKERIAGNCDNCQDDPRQNEIVAKVGEWGDKIESGGMTPQDLAYEYAFFQHWLYLKYTYKINDDKIRAFYEMAKSTNIDGCLKERMSEEAKSGQRPKENNVKQKKKKEDSKKSKELKSSDEDSNARWYFLVFAILFLIGWIRRSIDIHRAGRYVFGQFKNAGSPANQTPGTNANSAPSWEKQHQPEIYTQNRGEANQKGSTNDSYTPKENNIPSPTHPETKKSSPEKPFVPTPPPVEKKNTKETPANKPLPESKKEIIQEKPVPILPPEIKKLEPTPKEEVYSNTVLFARIPSGNLFFGFSPQPEYPDTPFVIDERTGTFDLVKDPQTLERLFSMIDQLKDACELMNINQPSLNTYEVKVKGVVVKEGDYWRIENKLKLDW